MPRDDGSSSWSSSSLTDPAVASQTGTEDDQEDEKPTEKEGANCRRKRMKMNEEASREIEERLRKKKRW